MALLADDGADRAEQLLLVTTRLTALVVEETGRIEAREAPLSGAEADEKNRLANAYRLELARIKQDKSLLAGAAPALIAELKARTSELQSNLDRHETALGAVKLIAEGLVHAMAEEMTRQLGGSRNYSAGGSLAQPSGPTPAVIDRSA